MVKKKALTYDFREGLKIFAEECSRDDLCFMARSNLLFGVLYRKM